MVIMELAETGMKRRKLGEKIKVVGKLESVIQPWRQVAELTCSLPVALEADLPGIGGRAEAGGL